TAQREQIRQALLTKHTEVEFRLKATKSAKDFTAKIGAKLPKGVEPDGLPSDLTRKIPQLADYGYAKMKDQILIVNGLDGKIAEIIPETQPQTTGQKRHSKCATGRAPLKAVAYCCLSFVAFAAKSLNSDVGA